MKFKEIMKAGRITFVSTFLMLFATSSVFAAVPDVTEDAQLQSTILRERVPNKAKLNPASTDEIGDITSGKGSNYITASDLNTQTVEQLVQKIVGDGVQITNVRYVGTPASAGSFTTDDTSILGFKEGVILSSGDIRNIDGPNESTGVTQDNMLAGDQELDLLIPGYTTYDATILEFDFIPNENMLSFEYVFSSDEYNEFVGSDFNDVFGFFLNGKNIALIPNTNTPVSINNVNNGYGDGYSDEYGQVPTNPEYFRDNTAGLFNTEMDGLTTVLTAKAAVNPGEVNTIRLAIADAGDYVLDSNVCIKAASFSTIESDAVQFEKFSHTVNESAGTATVTVERTGNAAGTVSVSYYTENGSAKSGSDYEQTSGILTFAPGVKSLSFEVPVTDDSVAEGTEAINLYLKDIEGNAFISDNIKARLYIEDNDSAGTEYENLMLWDEMADVPTNKNFIVKFNMEIDPSTVTAGNFYVTNSSNTVLTEVTPQITYNKLSVIMNTNYFSYNAGETYYLNIAGTVKTASGKTLGKSVKMPFTIKDLQ